MKWLASLLGAMVLGCLPTLAVAQALVATAANFAVPAKALAEAYKQETGQGITIVSGSTGQLYAQIIAGAPFDAFLAADQERPRLLYERGAVAGQPFTYAEGKLVVWTAKPDHTAPDLAAALRAFGTDKIAIANPSLAPYGAAAQDLLATLNLTSETKGYLVFGQNVAQAYALAASGNAGGAIVAASVVPKGTGTSWPVPPGHHRPVLQDAVLVRATPAAIGFLDYLRSDAAREVVRAYGYLPASGSGG